MKKGLLDPVKRSEGDRKPSVLARRHGKWWLLFALPLAYSACGDSDEPSDNEPLAGRAGDGGRTGGSGGRGGSAGSGLGGTKGDGGAKPIGGSAGRPSGGTGALGGEGGASAGEGGLPGGEGGIPAGGAPTAGTSGSNQGGAGGDSGATSGGAGGELSGGAAGSGGGAPVAFCETLEPLGAGVSARSCFDFDGSGTAADFAVEGGEWAVVDGAYVGTGPEVAPSCVQDGTGMAAAILDDINASDVRVRAKISGIDRADKTIVLRHRTPSNRLELNFRANYGSGEGAGGGDLVVQELVDCFGHFRVEPETILVPHAITDVLEVDIELRGQRLRVMVNGAQVLDRTFSGANLLNTTAGQTGVAVITNGNARYDDLVVEALTPP